MLGKTHAIDAHDILGLGVDVPRNLHLRPGQPRLAFQLVPFGSLQRRKKIIEPAGMLGDELFIQHACFTRRLRLLIALYHALHHAHERRYVAARANLQIHVVHRGRTADRHLDRVLRIGEFDQPLFPKGIENDDLAAALYGFLQGMKDTRAVRARVLPHVENGIAMLEVVELTGTDG